MAIQRRFLSGVEENKADVVVDDSPLTLEKAIKSGALGAGLLFPLNEAYTSNGFRLFQNLNDVLDYILK